MCYFYRGFTVNYIINTDRHCYFLYCLLFVIKYVQTVLVVIISYNSRLFKCNVVGNQKQLNFSIKNIKKSKTKEYVLSITGSVFVVTYIFFSGKLNIYRKLILICGRLVLLNVLPVNKNVFILLSDTVIYIHIICYNL